MSSGKSKHFVTSRWTAAVVLVGMLILGFGTTARAHSEDDRSGNGLEGTWRAQLTILDCQTNVVLRSFPARFAFAKGGTLTLTTAGQPPSLYTAGLGVWRHTVGHSYSAVSEAFIFNTAGAWTQTQRLTRLIHVGIGGDTFTDVVALEVLDTNGNVIVTGCGTTVANRME